MCLGGPSIPHDDSAERARAEEAARQARVSAGREQIDQTFSGFDDSFFNKAAGDYSGYYNPQLDEQYVDARKKLVLNLAGTGNLTSSAGASRIGDLTKNYNKQQAEIADRALAAANDMRARVESQRSDLYGMNQTAADPAQAGSLALARAANLQAPQAFSPLGDAFGDVARSAATGYYLQSRGYPGLRTGDISFAGPSRPSVSNVST